MGFLDKLDAAITQNNSLLCIGLDPDMAKLPAHLKNSKTSYFDFCKAIVDSTAELVCAFKPNSAFFEARGAEGIQELQLLCDYIQNNYSEIPIILDFKRGDIGNTNKSYADFAFEYLGVDAVTVQPYQGREAVQAYLDYHEKGIIVLCRTSNEGAGEFQDLSVDGRPLYETVARNVAEDWNANDNCLLVVGATAPDELQKVREITGDDMVFLVPGIGAQGGDLAATLAVGLNASGRGLIINSSRDILYAGSGEDFGEAARSRATETRNAINNHRGV